MGIGRLFADDRGDKAGQPSDVDLHDVVGGCAAHTAGRKRLLTGGRELQRDHPGLRRRDDQREFRAARLPRARFSGV